MFETNWRTRADSKELQQRTGPSDYCAMGRSHGNVTTELNVHPVMTFDPLLDPIRQEPRFQAIERELKFPI